MRRLLPIIPYIAVAIGLYGLHSAWAALGFYHAGMLAAVLVLKDTNPTRPSLAIRRIWIALAACAFALGGVAFYILWPYLNHGSAITDRLADYGVTKHTWPLLAVYFCIVNSILEEFFWRGCLMSYSRWPQPTDLLFAGYHAFVLLAFATPIWTVPVIFAAAFAAGLWRMLRVATGSLAVPIITHVVADVSIALAVQWRAFG